MRCLTRALHATKTCRRVHGCDGSHARSTRHLATASSDACLPTTSQAGKSLGRAALLALQRTARCLSQDCHRSRGHGWRLPDDPGPFRVPPMLLALGSLALGAAMALVAMNRPVKPPRAPRAPVFKIAVREGDEARDDFVVRMAMTDGHACRPCLGHIC